MRTRILAWGSRNRTLAVGGLGIGTVLAWSWWEILFLPLGDSHDGRINGRFGLHLRNLADHGLAGSDFLASMDPFTSQSYAHHPPLLNLVQAFSGSVFGLGDWQLHLVGFLSGLLTIGALLWISSEIGIRPGVAVGVTAVVAATPMFWIYARLGLGMSLMLVFLAAWLRARDRVENARWTRLAVGAAVLLSLSSWTGVVLVGVVALIGYRSVATRSLAVRVGRGAVMALVVVMVWVLGATSVTELADHAASRVHSPVSMSEFIAQYRWFYTTLFPSWFAWLMPVWVAVAVLSSRTRSSTGPLFIVMAAWTVGLPEAAFVHDYWTYPLLGVVALGAMVALDRIVDAGIQQSLVAVALLVLAVSSFSAMEQAGYRESYFLAPAEAGALVSSINPQAGQETAWVSGVELPRWVSFYWDLPVVALTPSFLETANDDDLVLMRTDRRPSWLAAAPVPFATSGRYALVRVRSIRALVLEDVRTGVVPQANRLSG